MYLVTLLHADFKDGIQTRIHIMKYMWLKLQTAVQQGGMRGMGDQMHVLSGAEMLKCLDETQ